ncbi:MAG: hypothetical protein K0R63_1277 [Rickettsiales bacterium]|jgi:uncharacterized protein with PIN domain|nr:hypothetical protein [Rickettsiales bacterium]
MKTLQTLALLDKLTSNEKEGQAVEWSTEIDNMISVIARLTELLSFETAYLRKREVSKLKALQEEKDSLTSILELYKARLHREQGALKSLFLPKQQELKALFVLFEQVTQENQLELIKVRAINERVVEAVSNALQEHLETQTGYNPKGTRGDSVSIPPIAFSEQI